ncbi:hypothetical protein LXA43DRAFT_1103842 [Ganoderma leucocontextum]|nr:hypothetical protein LXA43DRAFT_1103842 [Ganoderma leucocontextum]
MEDLAVTPSRSLYKIAGSIQRVSDTSVIVQHGHVGTPAIAGNGAMQRVLHEEALVYGIVESLVKSYTKGNHQPPDTAKQLVRVALTCKDWFHPAIDSLWRTFHNLPALVLLLIPENLRGVLNTPETQYMYIWETYFANPVHGRLHPQFLIFRFYAGWIRTLRMSGTDFTTPVFSMLGRLYDADVLFPALQSVDWSDGVADISNNALRTFGLICRAPLISSLVINVNNADKEPDMKDRMLEQTCVLLEKAASYAPELTALTVVGPRGIALPISFLASFSQLEDVNVQINLKVPESLPLPLPPKANSNGGLPLQTLFLSWTISTDLVYILHIANFSNLRSLTLTADDHPPITFLEQIQKLGKYTTLSLVHLRIVAGIHFPVTIEGINFANVIEPFLECSAMEDVCIQLPSFSMPFLADDFQRMLDAWHGLTSLDVTFTVPDSHGHPDLRSVIHESSRICPKLSLLHLPAIATYRHVDQHFNLQIPSSPHTLCFSSDLIFLEHHPLDVAYRILKAFGYNPIRPMYVIGTYWAAVDTLVQAIQHKDRHTILRFGMSDWYFPWGHIPS